jgi:hypothetical protein
MPRLKPMPGAPLKKVIIPLSYPSLRAKLESEHQDLSPVNGISHWPDRSCASTSFELSSPLKPKMSYNFLKKPNTKPNKTRVLVNEPLFCLTNEKLQPRYTPDTPGFSQSKKSITPTPQTARF